ncbi:MAG: TIGR00730 family Rossman fold protein, partial [Paracoccaceae bacterium]|nr:TIGR00730 family Rossman fold protein [Paracoccaceae bacterium]
LLKTEILMAEFGVTSTVAMFGSARIPAPDADNTDGATAALARYYQEAREFARLMTLKCVETGRRDGVIVTGGGPGIMEAGNRGAADAGGVSIGLNVVLPHEQAPNEYVTPELCFNFHYFGIRKMHFLLRAKAIAFFPGGFGTLDELFESLTLIQTGRMAQVPILLFGSEFWERVVNWQALAEAGTIADEDLELFRYVETAAEAVELIQTWEGAGVKRTHIPGR